MVKIKRFLFLILIFVFSFSLFVFASDFEIDDRSSLINYSSRSTAFASGAYNGTLSSVSYGGDISFDFYGSDLFIYTSEYTNSGRAWVFIDGDYIGTTNRISTSNSYNPGILAFSSISLLPGKHSCTLVASDQTVYNPSLQSVTGRFYLDYIGFAKDPDVSDIIPLSQTLFLALLTGLFSVYFIFTLVFWRLHSDD